jgi:hypothetical protein
MAHALIWNGYEFSEMPRDKAVSQAESGALSVYDAILPCQWVVIKDGEQIEDLLWPEQYAQTKSKPRKTTKKRTAKRKAETKPVETEQPVVDDEDKKPEPSDEG